MPLVGLITKRHQMQPVGSAPGIVSVAAGSVVAWDHENTRRSQGMATVRLVVIGGDAAGMSAAAQAKRLDKGMEVIAFEKGPHTSYSA